MSEKDGGAVLYRRYLDGDGDALGELVERYAGSLVLFINRYVNNISVAEELMEDTFCDIVMKHRHFKGESTFKTYLFTIARNKAVDYIRKASRYECVPLEDAKYSDMLICSIEDDVIKGEENRVLWDAMNKLKDDYRSVLYLVYFERLSYDEVGRVMKRSRSQIKNLAHRAKAALKTKLEEGGFIYEGV